MSVVTVSHYQVPESFLPKKKKSSWKLLPPLPFRMNSEIFSKASPQPRSYRRRDEEIWKAWLEMSQLSRCVPTSFMRPTNQSQQSVSTAGWESYCTRRTNCPFTLGRCSASLFRLWYLTCKKKKLLKTVFNVEKWYDPRPKNTTQRYVENPKAITFYIWGLSVIPTKKKKNIWGLEPGNGCPNI